MIVLGIDPGLAHTGWGIVEGRKGVCRAHAYGCITTHKELDITYRLKKIFDELNAVILKYRPQEVAIEEIFFSANARSAVATAQARGAALVACAGCGLQTGQYTPMQIKQAVVGTGSADKKQVQYMIQSILKLDHQPHPDHAADALAAAICHINLSRFRLTAREVEGLDKMGSWR